MLHHNKIDKPSARVFFRKQTSQFLQEQQHCDHKAFSHEILTQLKDCWPLLAGSLPTVEKSNQGLMAGAYLANANEPCEKELVNWLRTQGWAVAYSRLLNWHPPQMVFLRVDNEAQEVEWFINNRGAPVVRQVKGTFADKTEAHCPLYFVPATAFSQSGFRLGAGKGFYDYYFTNLRKLGHKFVVLGLCWETQIMENYPVSCHWKAEPHDFKIDFLISEKRWYSCQQHLPSSSA